MKIESIAANGDLSPLAKLHAACFSQAWTEPALRELLDAPGTFVFVADDGFVMARVAGDEAEILTLAVLAAARRRGLGAALLEAAALHAHASGAQTMVLEVGAANAAARALYARFGFRVVGRRKAYYAQEDGDALILRVELPSMPLGK